MNEITTSAAYNRALAEHTRAGAEPLNQFDAATSRSAAPNSTKAAAELEGP